MNRLTYFIITTLISSAVGGIGFWGGKIYENHTTKKQIAFELNRELYDEHHSKITALKEAFDNLFIKYNDGFALTSYEIDKEYKEFIKARNSYAEYIHKLEQYGNDAQLSAVKLVHNISGRAYEEFFLMNDLAKRVQSIASDLLAESPKSSNSSFHLERFDSELNRFISNENRAYYALRLHIRPILNSREQYVNYTFRNTLEIGQTKSIIDSVNGMNTLVEEYNQYKYTKKKHPFHFAKTRAMAAPNIKTNAPDDFFKPHNDSAKNYVKEKVIMLTIDNDKYLQEDLIAQGTLKPLEPKRTD